ncbi:TlpA family protein disulfide reductase [Thermoproteota archaeon]
MSVTVFLAGYSSKPVKDAKEGAITPDTAQLEELTLKTISNKIIDFKDLKSNIIIIDFFATWCPPCIAEIPHFIEIQTKYKSKGVKIIGISLDNDYAKLTKFVEQTKMNYPVILSSSTLLEIFGSIYSIPTTFIFDKEFHLIKKVVGYHDQSFFEKEIENLL